MQRLFVYGTLAPGRENQHFLKDIGGFWQKASVRGRLSQNGLGATFGYPAIVLDSLGDEVNGFLFTSNRLSEHWVELDEFEGECYARVLTMVTLSDKRVLETYALR